MLLLDIVRKRQCNNKIVRKNTKTDFRFLLEYLLRYRSTEGIKVMKDIERFIRMDSILYPLSSPQYIEVRHKIQA